MSLYHGPKGIHLKGNDNVKANGTDIWSWSLAGLSGLRANGNRNSDARPDNRSSENGKPGRAKAL